jgi:hypothetical protein
MKTSLHQYKFKTQKQWVTTLNQAFKKRAIALPRSATQYFAVLGGTNGKIENCTGNVRERCY